MDAHNPRKITPWFLGPKAENADIQESLILQALRDYIFWRRNYFPEDKILIKQQDRKLPENQEWVDRLLQRHQELLAKLKRDFPFYSPRYIGHMVSDQVIPAVVGYFTAMLYNPNNVTSEAAPVTADMEIAVGKQLGQMLGLGPGQVWAHITSGGTVANFEALWVARNAKYFPLAAQDAARKLGLETVCVRTPDGKNRPLVQMDPWECLNLNPGLVLSLSDALIDAHYQQEKKHRFWKHARETITSILKENKQPFAHNETLCIQRWLVTEIIPLEVHVPGGRSLRDLTLTECQACQSEDPQLPERLWDEITDRYIESEIIPLHSGFRGEIEKTVHQNITDSNFNLSSRGLQFAKDLRISTGKILVSDTRHYSIDKIAEALGLGRRAVIPVKIGANFRMDISDLEKKLELLRKNRDLVIAVISCLGTTEEGAIDPLHEVLRVRRNMEHKGQMSFWVHADAAYGGYIRSTLVRPGSNPGPEQCWTIDELKEITLTEVETETQKNKLFWPHDANIYYSLKSLESCDSITIDPHKLGYIPYPAGAIVFRSRRVRDLVSYLPPYIHQHGKEFIGGYILEGSKPGAAAASCWLAQETIPLDSSGYGTIIRETIRASLELFQRLNWGSVPDRYRIYTLCRPDTNIVCFVVNEWDNHELDRMNGLNMSLYERFAITDDRSIHTQPFFLSKTILSHSVYQGTPVEKLFKDLQIDWAPYAHNDLDLFVLRATLMSPWLSQSYQDEYISAFVAVLQKVIDSLIESRYPLGTQIRRGERLS